MELILEMEGGGINKKERMKIEEKKTKKENEKMNRLEEFNRKKNGGDETDAEERGDGS